MSQQQFTATPQAKDDDPFSRPVVIVLGDAATLTRGSDQNSIENKRDPYD
jgi:hypothetical protein